VLLDLIHRVFCSLPLLNDCSITEQSEDAFEVRTGMVCILFVLISISSKSYTIIATISKRFYYTLARKRISAEGLRPQTPVQVND